MFFRDELESNLYCGFGVKMLAPRIQKKFHISHREVQLVIDLDKERKGNQHASNDTMLQDEEVGGPGCDHL